MKKIVFYMLMLPLMTGFMLSCSGTKADAKKLDGSWVITEVEGDPVITDREAFMEFNIRENKLHGNAGCNVFNSTVSFDDSDESAVKIDRAVSTMMACPDMETENKIMKTLESVSHVKAGNKSNELLLTNSMGRTLLVLTKK